MQDGLGALPLLGPGRQPRAEFARRRGRALVEARRVADGQAVGRARSLRGSAG